MGTGTRQGVPLGLTRAAANVVARWAIHAMTSIGFPLVFALRTASSIRALPLDRLADPLRRYLRVRHE